METITLTKDELKEIVQECMQETIADLLHNSARLSELLESTEDFYFGKMIEQGRTGRFVSEETIMRQLGHMPVSSK